MNTVKPKIDHQSYIIPGKIDGSVMHKQAWDRLVDTFRGYGQTTIVHAHRVGVSCGEECSFYHWDKNGEPINHPVLHACLGHYATDPKKEK